MKSASRSRRAMNDAQFKSPRMSGGRVPLYDSPRTPLSKHPKMKYQKLNVLSGGD